MAPERTVAATGGEVGADAAVGEAAVGEAAVGEAAVGEATRAAGGGAERAVPAADRPWGGGARRPLGGVPAGVAALARPAAIYVASRPLVLAAVALAGLLHPSLTFARGLTTWDSSWYLLTARSGYPTTLPMTHGHVGASTIPFFPLFPYSIRVLSMVTGLPLAVAGLLLSSLLGLAATVLVWALCRHLWGAGAADRAAASFCFFPGSFVFSLVYSEGLLIALAAGCILALRTRRWVLAGILAGLATATNPIALAVIAACAWESLVAIVRRREWRSVVAPVLAPAGLVGYLAFLWVWTGDPAALFATEQGGWHQHYALAVPWHALRAFVGHPFADLNVAVVTLGIFFVIAVGALLLWTRVPGVIVVYTVGIAVLAAFSPAVGLRPRMLLIAFPLLAVLGYRLRGGAFGALVGFWGSALVLLTAISVSTLLITP